MADQLRVDADQAFTTSHAVSIDAEELREQLSHLSWEWDNLSHTWSGIAASAFTPAWEEWKEGASKIIEALAESSRRLAQAGLIYEEQDTSSAHTLGSIGNGIGL
jgi:WXG100 family type VII secretion target